MEKDRKTKVLAVIAIIIAVVSLTIGFAAFSTTLSIDGTGDVKSSSWKVRFENLQPVQRVGTAVETTAPTINTNDTTISNFDVSFTTPGDSVSYTFDIANKGTFDAEITSINIPTPTCQGTGTNAEEDATNVCDNLEYKLTYTDGGAALAQADTLNKGETKNVTLTLTYKDTIGATELPQDNVDINNLGISIVYSQK